MLIDVIFDPICPWCYIGKRRLEQALGLRPNIKPAVGWRPFLLNPQIPAEGIDRTAYLIKKYGSETRVRRILGSIFQAGQSVEIKFDFEAIGHTPNSVDAHRLVRYAERFSKTEHAVEELFRGFLLKGRDIGDIQVLADIGNEIGLDKKELMDFLEGDDETIFVMNENARAHRLGVNGVPAFVFNEQMVIAGAQEAPVLAKMLDAAQAGEDAA
ncbi:MAG: DsbA family oxidoreductase [Rhodospirillales bacterium]